MLRKCHLGSSIALLLMVIFSLSFCFTQTHSAVPGALKVVSGSQTGKTQKRPPIPDTAQIVGASYWTAEPGWHTVLELRNNLAARTLKVTPVLRTESGQDFPLATVSLAPDQVQSIDLESALATSAPNLLHKTGAFGSVVFKYSSLHNRNVYASVVIHREGHPIGYHFDAFQPFPVGGFRTESIWWLPRQSSTEYLILSNSSDQKVAGTVQLTDSEGKAVTLEVALPGKGMKRVDVGEMLKRQHLSGSYGGITIQFGSLAGMVMMNNVIFDETAGMSAILKLQDRFDNSKVEPVTLRAPMVALAKADDWLGLPPDAELHPNLFLRNTSNDPIQPTLSVNWSSGADSGRSEVPVAFLAPGETRFFDLSSFQKDGTIPAAATWGTVTVSYSGAKGDIISVAATSNEYSGYVLQSPFTSSLSFQWKGGIWRVDDTHNTLITGGNGGAKPTTLGVNLYSPDGKLKYEIPPKELKPGDQAWIDVGKLIRGRIPDKNGKLLPGSMTAGSYELLDLGDRLGGSIYEGKLVLDKEYGMVTYGCATCCGYTDIEFEFSPVYLFAGDQFAETVLGSNTCQGTVNLTSSGGTWGSTDSSIVLPLKPNITAEASGTATINVPFNNVRGPFPMPGKEYVCEYTSYNPQANVVVSPVINQISPAQGLVGSTVKGVTISGKGFGSSPSVSAGQNIAVTVTSKSDTQIVADFAITNAATAGGNQSVKVTAGGQPSNALNFFVQIPTHFRRFDLPPNFPGGLGPVIVLTDGNVVDPNGNVLLTHQCGVYENFAFDVADQETPPVRITNGTVIITEVFTNISRGNGPKPSTNTIDLSHVVQGDTQYFGFAAPDCPQTNENQTLDMGWTLAIGTAVYPISTIVHIEKGNFNGTLNVTSTMTTP